MTPLIAELKDEHQAIFQLLGEIDELGIESTAGREKLMAAKKLFMSHLDKEDRKVHAILDQAQTENPELRETMYLMHFNLKDVTRFVTEFFNKHADGGHQESFDGDFDLIRVLLKNRIRREERVLFREFEKITRTA